MKYLLLALLLVLLLSRPARGAWVEMSVMVQLPALATVAPRKGRVG